MNKQGWEVRRLDEVFNLQMGKTPSRDNITYWSEGVYPWASISDIPNEKYISSTKERISEIAKKELKLKHVPKNTVIMSFKLSIGKVAITSHNMYTNEAIMAFYPLGTQNLVLDFIYYYLKGYKWNVHSRAVKGITMNKASISATKISIPPLPIQNQIVKELDTLQAIITKKKTQLDELDKLAQATFYDMFGDPVENERGWESKIITKIADTIVPGRDKPKSFTGHIPWINTADLNNLGYINDSKSKLYLTKSEIAEVKAKIIPANSIIMTCVGDLGITSINSIEVVINQQLHSYQCHSSVNNIFVMFCLSLNKDYMYKMATSTTLPYMNKTVCNNISIPTPPLPLQNQFAKQIEAIEKQKALINQSIAETQLLFDSAMDNYFN